MRRLIPSRALLLLAAVPLLVSMLALARPELGPAALLLDAGLLALALLDGLLALGLKVNVQRTAPDVMSLGRRNRVALRLRSESRLALLVSVTDDLFQGAEARDLPIRVALGRRGVATVEYHVEPSQRGAHALGDHYLRLPSPLGLWALQRRIPGQQRVRVYPDLKQLQQFDALAKQDRELSFVRASRHKGGESEFARLRDHVPDDDVKRVDWKATARRQKLTVREYQLESNQNLMFLLDAGRVMTGLDSGISRFDHALNASLMLAHVAARAGDRVGALGFDDDLRVFMPPQAGRQASRAIIQATYDLFPRLVERAARIAKSYIDSRLRERYAVPFTAPYPEEIVSISDILTKCMVISLQAKHAPIMPKALKKRDDAHDGCSLAVLWLDDLASGKASLELPQTTGAAGLHTRQGYTPIFDVDSSTNHAPDTDLIDRINRERD